MVHKSLRMNASASTELPAAPREFKPRVKSLKSLDAVEDPTAKKYIHVHHFKNTKLFGAWFNDPSKAGKKVRLFFGSHLTAYLAARAQDRAALKYKPYALDPRSIKLNFKEKDYDADKKLREMLTCEEFGELLRKESRPKYTKMEPTPCLSKFLARERAHGNIPSAVPPEENVISLNQYLKEVIRKRAQPDEDMEDPVPTDEESSEYQESSDEEMENPVPTAKQKKNKHALKLERKKRSEGMKRNKPSEGKRMAVYAASSTARFPVAGPSERKPLVVDPAPLVWGQKRPRTKRYEDLEYIKLQNKLHKIDSTNIKKSCEPATPIKAEALPPEVDNIRKSPAGAPVDPESVQPTAEEKKKNPEAGNEGLPQSPDELKFTIKWQYKMHQKQKLQTSRPEILPAKVENTKTPDQSGLEGLPPSPEFPKLQFRSKWHYKLHEKQKLQTTSEPPPPENVEADSYLQALAKTMLSQAEKLI